MTSSNAKQYDIIIIGGGAAGLAAAVNAHLTDRDVSILLMEKNDKLGKKLYATGNGRCNLVNKYAYGCWDVLYMFEDIGMMATEEDEGRFYPSSGMAEDVVFYLENYVRRTGVEVMLNTAVDAVEQLEDGESYAVRSGDFCATARQVLIATGGKAAPMYGTTGDGYVMARKLGYELAPLHPALTGIETNVTTLKGVRARAIVTLYRKGDKIYEEFGQVQFTDYGMSGIVIMNASKLVELRDGLTFDDYELVLNFIPDRIDAELKALIGHRMEKGVNTIRGFVPQKLSSYIEARTEEQLQNPEENNDASEIYFRALRESHFKVTGVHGWKTAQCTAGGVKLDQVFERTMASRKHRGLYFAGEVLDECGPCGGFNLTQAFFTGLKAGRAMAFSSKIRRRF